VTRDPRDHHQICHHREAKPPMPTLWSWIKDAKYAGKHKIGERTYDQWNATVGAGVSLTVSVGETTPDRPYYFRRKSSTENFELHFVQWELRKPNASWFEGPRPARTPPSRAR